MVWPGIHLIFLHFLISFICCVDFQVQRSNNICIRFASQTIIIRKIIPQMNAFQKLKLTIDRVGLDYIQDEKTSPENDSKKTGLVQKKVEFNAQEQNQSPRFNNYGQTQSKVEEHKSKRGYRSVVHEEQIEELKLIHQKQQNSYVQEIKALTQQIQTQRQSIVQFSHQKQQQAAEITSLERQNLELKACIQDIEEKSSKKMSESGVLDKERKYKEEIARINETVAELARDLNQETVEKRTLQKQLESAQKTLQQVESSRALQKQEHNMAVDTLKQELEKRQQLLEHSIKSARDEKIAHKNQIAAQSTLSQNRKAQLSETISALKDENYKLNNSITSLQYQIQTFKDKVTSLERNLSDATSKNESFEKVIQNQKERIEQLTNSCNEMKVQNNYLKQELEGERSNSKVKVVEVIDESLELELGMYKKQCKQLLKERSILKGLDGSKVESRNFPDENSNYTVVEQTMRILK